MNVLLHQELGQENVHRFRETGQESVPRSVRDLVIVHRVEDQEVPDESHILDETNENAGHLGMIVMSPVESDDLNVGLEQ